MAIGNNLGGGFLQANARQQRTKVLAFCGLSGLLGVICLGSAFYFSQSHQQQLAATPVIVEHEAPKRMVQIYVPREFIRPGAALDPLLFRSETVAADSVSEMAITDLSQISGRYARSAIPAGAYLHTDQITNVRPSSVLTASIPPGHRAVTISVNALSSVEGWARAGAHVDVSWSSQIRGETAMTVIVENALVLSAERQADPNAPQNNQGAPVPSTVTLLVSEADSQRILLAQSSGQMSLTLRGEGDSGKAVRSRTLTTASLLGGPREGLTRPSNELVTIRGRDGLIRHYRFDGGKLSLMTVE